MIYSVAGYCPMGCGETLTLGKGGHVTCSSSRCPDPTKVDDILHDRETEHVMRCDETGFTIQHPLRERGGDLFKCQVFHEVAAYLDGPPNGEPGDYRVRILGHDPTSESFRSGAGPHFEFERVDAPSCEA